MKTIVSSKYQVVIPKSVRKDLGIKPGQKVSVKRSGPDGIMIIIPLSTQQITDKYAGCMPAGTWGKDPVATMRNLRSEWDK